jgi:hypothetical protein
MSQSQSLLRPILLLLLLLLQQTQTPGRLAAAMRAASAALSLTFTRQDFAAGNAD